MSVRKGGWQKALAGPASKSGPILAPLSGIMSLALLIALALSSQPEAKSPSVLRSLTDNEAVALSNSYVQNRLCASLPGNNLGVSDLIKFREQLIGFQGGYNGYFLPEAISAVDKLINANEPETSTYAAFARDIRAITQDKLKTSGRGQPYMINNGCSLRLDEGIPLTCQFLTVEQQDTIDRIFEMPTTIDNTEAILLNEDITPGVKRFTLEELNELKRLSSAQGQFESYIGLEADVGGWKGNADLGRRKESGEGVKGKSFHTVCGHIACIEEATNTHEFIRINYERKNLKYFEPGASFVHRDHPDDPLFPSHYATEVINSRTGERIVVDSWLENGGTPARVISYDQWRKENDLSLITHSKTDQSPEVPSSKESIEPRSLAGLIKAPLPSLSDVSTASIQTKFALLRAYKGKLVSLPEANVLAGRYADATEHPSIRDEAFIALENTVQAIKRETEKSANRTFTDEEYFDYLINEGYKNYAEIAKLVLSWKE